MKPDLRLRLHATQAQPCFPAASNALALPGGNGIFTATPTERITHYTLLRKVVCQMGALPPLETSTRKGGTLPLHGAHTAFSCYPALRLYRLSKSPRGIDVVSLTLGNSRLPARNSLRRHKQRSRQLLLSQIPQLPVFLDHVPCLHQLNLLIYSCINICICICTFILREGAFPVTQSLIEFHAISENVPAIPPTRLHCRRI